MAPARVISVPKTESGAYNLNRPAGKLLLAQSAHLREALIRHMKELADIVAIDLRSLKTEGDVSAYAERITAILHPQGVKHPRK
jgi:hypothetical protein